MMCLGTIFRFANGGFLGHRETEHENIDSLRVDMDQGSSALLRHSRAPAAVGRLTKRIGGHGPLS